MVKKEKKTAIRSDKIVTTGSKKIRNLIIILGDQLDEQSSAFEQFDPHHDLIWMAEVWQESTHIWSHQARIVLFLSAMRHFRIWLIEKGYPLCYHFLSERKEDGHSFADYLSRDLKQFLSEKLVVVQPGDYRVLEMLRGIARQNKIPLQILKDKHFLCDLEEFKEHAQNRKQLRMEFFYREMRKKYAILMVPGGKNNNLAQPEGGKWNYDEENRGVFEKGGPKNLTIPQSFPMDKITQEVIELVQQKFQGHPGKLDDFRWPVTRKEALSALDDFIENRLPLFGKYQDAMWMDEPFLYHSLLSSSLNLKLIHPIEVINRAVLAYREKKLSLSTVEGFIRQILGWREYVRGVYWYAMPGYLDLNVLDAHQALPAFYWNAETEMNCLRQVISQTLTYGYAHHIQRLMVTGLFALLLGVEPSQVHEWYLAVYVDAIEWVELPNTIGMSQFADGGLLGSKPYVASGKYIQRMSNYCNECEYDPAVSLGENACPFTNLYWDFLIRHENLLQKNPRMLMQLKNMQRLDQKSREGIQDQARRFRISLPVLER